MEELLPISVATMEPLGMAFVSSCKNRLGCMSEFVELDQESSSLFQMPFSFSTSASRTALAFIPGFRVWMIFRSSSAYSLASAMLATSTRFDKPRTFALASTWMIFAVLGQYSMSYWGRVPKGPSREPRARTTSALAMVRMAALDPQYP